MTLYIY